MAASVGTDTWKTRDTREKGGRMGQRPAVRELIAVYARENGGSFTAKALVEWFGARYPDVAAATVRTQLSEATRKGGTGGPLLERIRPGVYRSAVSEPGGPSRPGESGEPGTEAVGEVPGRLDLVLVGCVKSKRDTALPARDLYRSTLFEGRRGYAERSGAPWYVLSARWGLVRPEEEIAPYDLYLGGCSVSYRRAWGSFVVAQLAEERELGGTVVEVHAGGDYVEALRGPLRERGALLRAPLASLPLGHTLAWYRQRREEAGDGGPRTGRPVGTTGGTDRTVETADGTVETADGADGPHRPVATADTVARLSARAEALTPGTLRTRGQQLSAPGLYSWWVDEAGADDLGAGLGARIEPGVVYVGQAGATRQPSGVRSDNTLFGRLVGMHLGGRAEFSTFRLSLAAVLVERLGVTRRDEAALSEWMERHLSVVAVAVPDRDRLGELEGRVVAEMDPPLNLSRVESTPVRRRLSELRGAWRSG